MCCSVAGISPWTWSIPLNQHFPATSDLSVTVAAAQAAAKARQAVSDIQKQSASQAQGPATASAGQLSEQTLVPCGGGTQSQQRDGAGDGDNAMQAATTAATSWGQPPPARPPGQDAHVQKLHELNLLMKRKYSLEQGDSGDPLVKIKLEVEAVDLVVTKLLLLQQLRQQEIALAVELNRLAGVRDTQKEVTAAQERLQAGVILKQQQHQQEVAEMQRQQQELLGLLDPDGGPDLISDDGSDMESDSGSMMVV